MKNANAISHHTLAALLAAESRQGGVTCRVLATPTYINVNASGVVSAPNTELLFACIDSELETDSDNAFSALVCTIADFGA